MGFFFFFSLFNVQLGLRILVQNVILCINKVTETKFEQFNNNPFHV